MSKAPHPWQDGRRAWDRLRSWLPDRPATPGHSDDADVALAALADVGLLRHLLDQAELVAVRTARRHGRSWAEVATRLGVTRQSAWERWRELDETAADQPIGPLRATEPAGPTARSIRQTVSDVQAATAAELTALAGAGSGAESPEAAELARERRRRSTVVVPQVIGLSGDDARRLLHEHDLVGVSPDPDGPPLAVLGWLDAVVTDQSPEAGATVPPGSPVTLWLGRGRGSAGVREPRRPNPGPRTARAMRHEPSEQAVG